MNSFEKNQMRYSPDNELDPIGMGQTNGFVSHETTNGVLSPEILSGDPSSIHFNARSQDVFMSTVDPVIPNQDIPIEKWNNSNPRSGNLGSLREEKIYEYRNGMPVGDTEEQQKRHAKTDTMFRLNTKRMSYKGFEFGDFGFMTTDFDQLQRGHTQLSYL